jgi:uncharacterized membrane protein
MSDKVVSEAVLVHLYRGELSRKIAYRIRLDTTTNWAIGLSAAVGSFALSHPEIPHAVMLFAVTLDLLLLWVEARRFCDYQLSRYRVRLLESGCLAQALGTGGPEWASALRESYAIPRSPIGRWAAVAQRVQRNYLWLVTSVEVAWVFKVQLHGEGNLLRAASVGPIPGGVVFLGAAALLVALLGLAGSSVVEEVDWG